MLNTVILLGRLTKDPEIVISESGAKRLAINLAVGRDYKNQDGIYETDFIRCILWNSLAEHTCEYCKKGDTVGIKGRLQTNSYIKNDEREFVTEVLVEKLSFLYLKKSNESEKTEETEENLESEDFEEEIC